MPDVVEALADCLEAMRRGEDMDSYLALYPEYREELRPLLDVVRYIRPLPPEVVPSPVFRAETRGQILGRPEEGGKVFLSPD